MQSRIGIARSSLLRSFKARASYSIVQAKFLPRLPAGERRAALPQACLREISIFEAFEVALNEFASVMGLRAPRALGQCGKSPLNSRVKPDRKHRILRLYYLSSTSYDLANCHVCNSV